MTIKKGEDDDKIHVGFWGYPTKNPKGHLDLDESLAERIRAMKPQSSVEKQIRMDGWNPEDSSHLEHLATPVSFPYQSYQTLVRRPPTGIG